MSLWSLVRPAMSLFEWILRPWVLFTPAKDTCLRLNCLILGASTDRLFPIYVPREATVADLKYAIKDAKSPDYDTAPADMFDLWGVSVADSDLDVEITTLEGLDAKKLRPLMAITSLSILPNHLHILVQPPAAVKQLHISGK
jgi:hypothetical protein